MTTTSNQRRWTIKSAEDLGRAIAGLRTQHGLTQAELAKQGGVSRNYLAQLETGLTVAMLERVLRLLRRLGAEVTVSAPRPENGA